MRKNNTLRSLCIVILAGYLLSSKRNFFHFFKQFVYKIINFDYLKNALINVLETSRMLRTVSVVTVVQRILTVLIRRTAKKIGREKKYDY